MKSESKHPPVKQLSICGRVAEHKSETVRLHGGDESEILSALNDGQRDAGNQSFRVVWLPLREGAVRRVRKSGGGVGQSPRFP